MKSQSRRAAVSIPSNIAEGLTRKSKKDKLHFLNITQSSLSEIDAQLEISVRLGYLGDHKITETEDAMTSVEQLLSGLIRSFK